MLPLLLGLVVGGGGAWYATTETAKEVAEASQHDGPLVQTGNQLNKQIEQNNLIVWMVFAIVAFWLWKK